MRRAVRRRRVRMFRVCSRGVTDPRRSGATCRTASGWCPGSPLEARPPPEAAGRRWPVRGCRDEPPHPGSGPPTSARHPAALLRRPPPGCGRRAAAHVRPGTGRTARRVVAGDADAGRNDVCRGAGGAVGRRVAAPHVLRPTWHFVVPEDLRWIQRITAPKVESSMAARHRGLGLDDTTTARALRALESALAGPTPLVRREIAAVFGGAGLPTGGEQVGHLLLIAELRAVVCSGPPRGTQHTYVLVDETVPPGSCGRLGRRGGATRAGETVHGGSRAGIRA